MLVPLPVNWKGNKYILVIVDQFSKWIECCALPDQQAETIAKALIVPFLDSAVHWKFIKTRVVMWTVPLLDNSVSSRDFEDKNQCLQASFKLESGAL